MTLEQCEKWLKLYRAQCANEARRRRVCMKNTTNGSKALRSFAKQFNLKVKR